MKGSDKPKKLQKKVAQKSLKEKRAEKKALELLAGDGQIDLAVIDCDRHHPDDEELFTFLHTTRRVPTIR